MAKKAARSKAPTEGRGARIREELLKAKKEAGLDPPAAIPLGERFRVEGLSRPDGAISVELERAVQVRGEANRDFSFSHGEPDDLPLVKSLGTMLNLERRRLLDEAELAIERLGGVRASKLAAAVAAQLNVAASFAPGDERVAGLRARLDEIRLGAADYSRQDKDQPGGGQACTGEGEGKS